MAENHMAHALTWSGPTWLLAYAAGGACFPYMVCLMESNLNRCRSRRRYLARLLVWALLAQAPYHVLYPEDGLNVLFTLAVCLACMSLWDDVRTRWAALVLVFATAYASWGVIGPVCALLAHALPIADSKSRHEVATLITMLWYVFLCWGSWTDVTYGVIGGALALALIHLDDGRRGCIPGWVFYAWYPVHLGLIACLTGAW